MILVQSARHFSTVRCTLPTSSSPAPLRSRVFTFTSLPRRPSKFKCSSGLPFTAETAKYYKELEAAIDVVETASKLCVEVQSSLNSSGRQIPEKNDQTPVTVADFSVQALISLGNC
jgi:3'(2'), 5'-bisphosphate nucleotidase